MSLEVECKLCGEEYDMRHDGCPACWWRAHKRVPELETTNAELLEALLLAKGSVEWMACATDADPEDHERLAIVNKAIRKAGGEDD